MHAGERPDAHRALVRQAVDRHAGPLWRYARRLVGPRDPDAAGEIVQEVFLRLCQIHDRDPPQARAIQGYLEQWLYTVCRNLALDRLRREQRTAPLSDVQAAAAADDGPAPGESLQRAEQVSLVLRALDRLPGSQNEAIRLKFQHGLSYQQIAAVIGKSPGNVGFLISTGLKTIRQRLGATPP